MPIREMVGTIFDSEAQTLVNTVNCEGFMGKGLALEVKRRFPGVDRAYRQACASGALRPGVLQLVSAPERWILNFPTKDSWRAKSRMTFLEDGLEYFRDHYREWGIDSIAFPQLGCGLGGLRWSDVRPLMYEKLESLDIPVEIWVQPAFEGAQDSPSPRRRRSARRRQTSQARLL
jgi:O-acetyl-ADP-ribose deacetylase (regulator of RNase III)